MKTHRIEWTKVKITSRNRRKPSPPQGIALEDLVRQLGIDRAMRLMPELRQF